MSVKKQREESDASMKGTTTRAPGYGRLQQTLREEILAGRIAAGSRLKVSEIAKRFGVSTNPAREALQGLEGEGLVEIQPNRGARVKLVDEDMVRNIFDIRGLLEPYIIREFVEFATASDIEELRTRQNVCDLAVSEADYSGFHAANVAFHSYMIDRHYNSEAIRIMKQHSAWLNALSRKNPLTLPQMRSSNAEHWALFEAIAKGDPDGAVQAITAHMSRSREIFLSHMRMERIRAAS